MMIILEGHLDIVTVASSNIYKVYMYIQCVNTSFYNNKNNFIVLVFT